MKVGDVVRLKGSSVQKMTVEGVNGDKIQCVWFSEAGFLMRESFQRLSLQVLGESTNESKTESGLLLG